MEKRDMELRPAIIEDAEPIARQYLASIGFVEYSSNDRFADEIRSRFGKVGEEILRAIQLRADGRYTDDTFYPLKNSSLSLSLAVSFWNKGGFYTSFLNWFVRERLPAPSRILDIGCDNGILTCFYAKHFPEAEVVGIDVCESGVTRARELAAKLGLHNVAFSVLDVQKAADELSGSSFQMVTATHVFDTLLDLDEIQSVSSVAEVEQLDIRQADLSLLVSIRGLTALDGIILTTDSLDHRSSERWMLMLNRSGWSVNRDRSSIIHWSQSDRKRATCPIVVADNKEAGSSAYSRAATEP